MRSESIVIVVDDDEAMRELVRSAIEMHFVCEVVEAQSPEEVFGILESGLEPRLIVSDWKMGRLSGGDLLKYLRDNSVDVPVIIMSGENDIVRTHLPLPCVDVISKPFSDSVMVKRIAHIGVLDVTNTGPIKKAQ